MNFYIFVIYTGIKLNIHMIQITDACFIRRELNYVKVQNKDIIWDSFNLEKEDKISDGIQIMIDEISQHSPHEWKISP